MLQNSTYELRKASYIMRYYVRVAWLGKFEHVTGKVIHDLNHLLRMNEVRKALGLDPLPRDEYLEVRR